MSRAAEQNLAVHLVHQGFRDYTAGLVTGLAATGADLAVTTIRSGSAPAELPTGLVDGLEPDLVALPRFRHPTAPPAAWRAVARVARQPGDVIHWQAAGSPWVDLAFSRFVGRRPTVVTVHDMVPHPGDATILPGTFAAIRRLARRADRVIVHAEHVRHQAEAAGVDPDRIEVLAHGELASRYLPVERLPLAPVTDPTVLFFGRAQGYKGLDLLVEAMARVTSVLPAARLVVAGAGPGIDQALPGPHPSWCEVRAGRVADAEVAELFARAAVVGLPYREASQSGVAALAAGFGRPVVATAVPGLTDSVAHDVTGLLVEPGSVPALADALIRVLGDFALAHRLGRGAFEAARTRLAWPAIAREHGRIYRDAWLDRNGLGTRVPSEVR